MQKSCSRCNVFASPVAKPEGRTTIFTGRPAVFASRVAKPECRTTIFTGRPDRLIFYYFTIFLLFYYFISIRYQAQVFASRVAKPQCRTTIFTGRPAVFASRVAKPECRTTIFTGRPAVFASRVAKPECRTTIFTGRPHRLLFHYFTISFPFEFQAEVFASRVAKPECRTTIFTGRPAVFASRVAKPECRTTIFTGRPHRLLFHYFTISFQFEFQAEVFASRVAKPECRTTIFTGRPAVFASRVAKPECRTTIFTGRPAVFASRVAKPECRTTGRPDRLLYFHFHSVPGKGFVHVGPPILRVRRTPAFSKGFAASRTAFFACRLTFLHVGQTYPPDLRPELAPENPEFSLVLLSLKYQPLEAEGGHLLWNVGAPKPAARRSRVGTWRFRVDGLACGLYSAAVLGTPVEKSRL